ncbi:MAG: hypothetical protein R3D78_14015 [Paracoccaceae bacterium]
MRTKAAAARLRLQSPRRADINRNKREAHADTPFGTINPATHCRRGAALPADARRSRPAKTLTRCQRPDANAALEIEPPPPAKAPVRQARTLALHHWRAQLERLAKGIAEARARAAGLAEEAVTKAASQFPQARIAVSR